MGEIPRHIFVDEALAHRAYEDIALPIGFGQTISNPYVVARMLELARGRAVLGKVLEVGTGCGYQAAVLSRLAREVYSLERISQLLVRARLNLRELRIHNVRVRHADGSHGLKDAGPFDAIVMAAAAPQVPEALVEQLAPGGRLVLPVGSREQHLTLVEHSAQGPVQTVLEVVRFVPLLPGAAV
jgi:protein-L-isoaspartate(D-aspartate) O-methyltransferase